MLGSSERADAASGRGFLALLGVGILASVGILVGSRLGEDALPPTPAVADTPAAQAAHGKRGLDPGYAVERRSLDRNHLTQSLGALERHLNRAQLAFAEIDQLLETASLERGPAAAGPPPSGPPTRSLERMRRVGNLAEAPEGLAQASAPPARVEPMGAPPPGVEWVPSGAAQEYLSPAKNKADELWGAWVAEWPRDMEAVAQLTSQRKPADEDLATLHRDLSGLLEVCRQIPEGRPPSADARRQWLATQRSEMASLRARLEAAAQ